MKILNLGCGIKVSPHQDVINIDWSMYMRLKKSRIGRLVAPLILDKERLDNFRNMPDNILAHNLVKGIPFPSNSIDVVYHSHLLEHIDRDVVEDFLLEIKRVLRPGGVQRIVVPDFEQLCRDYLNHIAICAVHTTEREKHEQFISAIIEQSVRKQAFSSRYKHPIRRFLENIILGDARRRGETHQWMYDRVSLSVLLSKLGFQNITIQSYNTSIIPNWIAYGLDMDENGNPHKQKSLYIESEKPAK